MAVATIQWIESYGEKEYVEWFRDQLGRPPFNLWYCTASGVPGVVASQNDVESYQKTLKARAIFQRVEEYAEAFSSALERSAAQPAGAASASSGAQQATSGGGGRALAAATHPAAGRCRQQLQLTTKREGRGVA